MWREGDAEPGVGVPIGVAREHATAVGRKNDDASDSLKSSFIDRVFGGIFEGGGAPSMRASMCLRPRGGDEDVED